MRNGLNGVKVGDKIKAPNPYQRGSYAIHTVERLTKTQAVCDKVAFRIDSGLKVGTGDSWERVYGVLVSDKEVAKLNEEFAFRKRLIRAHREIQAIKITAANIEAAEAFIAASQPKEPAK